MTSPAADAPLDIEALRETHSTAVIGHTIEYFAVIGSTNDRVRELAASGAAEGVVVIAEAQTQGRGRLGRRWESPPHRNLYLSLLLRPSIESEQVPLIALVAGLATADAVGVWAPQARIKWPNDVLIDDRKTAGILTELCTGPAGLAVVVGIGVNVNISRAEFPEELREKATSVSAATGQGVDRTAFASTLLSKLQVRYDAFCRGGFAVLRNEWDALSCLNGRRVRISGAGTTVSGIVAGMRDDGTLRLISDDGSEMAVVAGDVTVVDGYGSNPPNRL